MGVPLDLDRIAELGGLVGSDLQAIVDALLATMAAEIDVLERALLAHDLGRAAYAAHRCRNDALIVGAAQLQAALAEVEAASRDGRLEPAREAFGRARAAWPATRAQLERLATRDAAS